MGDYRCRLGNLCRGDRDVVHQRHNLPGLLVNEANRATVRRT